MEAYHYEKELINKEQSIHSKNTKIKSNTNFSTDQLTNYINQIKKYPILSREEETRIAILAKNSDFAARDKLICSNLMLIVKIAHEYKGIFGNIMDLIQEGGVGISIAVSKYDPSRGYRFSTYAGWWIRSMILRYMFNNSHMIKPGTTNEHKKLFYNLRKEQKRLDMLGLDSDAATIAKNLDVSEQGVIDMDARLRNDLYLDSSAPHDDSDDSNMSLMDCVAAPIEHRPDVELESDEYNEMLREKLDSFAKKLKNDRHRDIFYKRIIAGDDALTLQEIGDSYQISKERVRQQEEEILIKLKKYLRNIINS